MVISPRLGQLENRLLYKVDETHHVQDVCIIGGGIAGMMTAYMLLMHTKRSVTLIEANRIACGATGHNAGQAAAYFEKPFDDIVAEYGYEQARSAQEALVMGRKMLEDILSHEKLTVPYEKCTGYAGLTSVEQLVQHLRRKHLRNAGGVVFDAILIDDTIDIETIPHTYRAYVTPIPSTQLRDLLGTADQQYIAAGVSIKGTINSALFCEEIALVLRTRFPKRFFISEETKVTCIDTTGDSPAVSVERGEDTLFRSTKDVILCTNGYINVSFRTKCGVIESWFSKSRYSIVGYMIGVFTPPTDRSRCISYFPQTKDVDDLSSDHTLDVYYYLTSRKYGERGLICLGGPEKEADHTLSDSALDDCSDEMHDQMMAFLSSTRRAQSFSKADFRRSGLMGYTQRGLRDIGPDPDEPYIRYNLGCNGVGICSSVYGAWKIMKQFQGETFPPSVFDVVRD